jgi:hypothetical protein
MCSRGTSEPNPELSPAAKLFDNQDLTSAFPTKEMQRRIVQQRSVLACASPLCIDSSAWHNYTWGLNGTTQVGSLLAVGRLSEGIAT